MDTIAIMIVALCVIVPIVAGIVRCARRRRARRLEQELMEKARAREREEALRKKPEPEPEPPPPRPFSVEDRGFRKLGEVDMGFPMKFYWHPEMKMELALSNVNGTYIVKGMKKYYVKAMSESGHETWDRSLGTVMDILRASFPEYHVYGCGVAHLPRGMMSDMEREIAEEQKAVSDWESLMGQLRYRKSQARDRLDEAARERAQLEGERQAQKEYDRRRMQMERQMDRQAQMRLATSQAGGEADRPAEYHHVDYESDSRAEMARGSAKAQYEKEREERKQRRLNEDIREAQREMEAHKQSLTVKKATMNQFLEYGVGTCCVIGFSTVMRVGGQKDLETMTEKTVEEITSAHRYGAFTQSLTRNFRIYHEEVQHPWLTHMAEYVGMFNPQDVGANPGGLGQLGEQVYPMFMKTLTEDTEVEGVKIKGKQTPARLLKAFLDRVDKVPGRWVSDLPKSGGWVGNVMYGNHRSSNPFLFSMHKLSHGYVSGTTGSGKTFTGRVLVENAIIEGVNVVVFDTTRQWCGLALPASGRILRRYDTLGVSRDYARGFPVKLYTPMGAGLDVPPSPDVLLQGWNVVSLRGMDDRERCSIVRDVLQAAYDTHQEETERLKTLIVVEEAHSLLPNRVSPDAKGVATEVRNLIDRIARELRKYGVNLLLITQSLSDFQREARMVREMTNTKFFMRTIDRTETQLVEQYISDTASGQVRNLNVGEALVFTPFIDGMKVYIRPPFSHVGAVSDKQIRQVMKMESQKEQFLFKVVQGGAKESVEDRVLRVVNEHYQMGESLNVTELMTAVNVSSKKVIHRLVDRLEARGKIRTRIDRSSRGAPRVIVPVFEEEEAEETESPDSENADE